MDSEVRKRHEITLFKKMDDDDDDVNEKQLNH